LPIALTAYTDSSSGANVSSEVSDNRTEWPLQGGAVELDLHHPWSFVYINLGIGNNITNFNLTLTSGLLNVTGKGNFCIPALPIPEGSVSDGQNATLQFVTNGNSGSALYNVSAELLLLPDMEGY
jgi:hypothetical protein